MFTILFNFSAFSLLLVSIEKICQTLKTAFEHISKHLDVREKCSAARRIFNSLFEVSKFDILHQSDPRNRSNKVNQITQESLATFRTLSSLANSFLSNSPNGSRHNKCYSAYKSTIKPILFDTVHLSIDCLFQDSSVR